jgi:hypothetical protein
MGFVRLSSEETPMRRVVLLAVATALLLAAAAIAREAGDGRAASDASAAEINAEPVFVPDSVLLLWNC